MRLDDDRTFASIARPDEDVLARDVLDKDGRTHGGEV